MMGGRSLVVPASSESVTDKLMRGNALHENVRVKKKSWEDRAGPPRPPVVTWCVRSARARPKLATGVWGDGTSPQPFSSY
jgi:hypothetical protein